MALISELESSLTSPELAKSWSEVFENTSGLKTDQIIALKKWIQDYRDQFLQQLKDVTFDEGLEIILPLKYIEIKCYWIMHNTQIQFQAMMTGDTNPIDLARGSLISILLSNFEKFVNTTIKEQVEAFISQPMNKISDEGFVQMDADKIIIYGSNRVMLKKKSN